MSPIRSLSSRSRRLKHHRLSHTTSVTLKQSHRSQCLNITRGSAQRRQRKKHQEMLSQPSFRGRDTEPVCQKTWVKMFFIFSLTFCWLDFYTLHCGNPQVASFFLPSVITTLNPQHKNGHTRRIRDRTMRQDVTVVTSRKEPTKCHLGSLNSDLL